MQNCLFYICCGPRYEQQSYAEINLLFYSTNMAAVPILLV